MRLLLSARSRPARDREGIPGAGFQVPRQRATTGAKSSRQKRKRGAWWIEPLRPLAGQEKLVKLLQPSETTLVLAHRQPKNSSFRGVST